MSKDDEIAKRYYQDYGQRDYDAAVHGLWEDHNKYGRNGNCPNWPPTLEQVKKAVESEEQGRAYENERR